MNTQIRLALIGAIAAAILAVIILLIVDGGEEEDGAPAAPTQTATAFPASPGPSPTIAPSPTAAPTPTATSTPGPTATPAPPDLAFIAIATLRNELDVPASELRLLSYEQRIYSSADLGCPAPGVIYIQVETPGWVFLIQHGDDTIDFRSDESGGTLVNCTAIRESGIPTINVAQSAGLTDATRVDLSRYNFATQEYEPIAAIDDRAVVEQFASLLDLPIPLTERVDCTPIFRLAFRLGGETAEFGYICRDDSNLIRGEQGFWQSLDGAAPIQLGSLVGPYVSAQPIPGFPPTP